MKEPLEWEDNFDRIVGTRKTPPDGLTTQTSRIQNAVAWRKSLGGLNIPKGVYRFHSHEEADTWLWKMIVRPRQS